MASPTASALPEEPVRDRAVRLFSYLRDLTELRSKTVRDSAAYDEVIWLADIPREPGCRCAAWQPVQADEDADVWVEIRAPTLKGPPPVPEILRPWLDPREVEDPSCELLRLPEQITVPAAGASADEPDGTAADKRALSDNPHVKARWQQYVSDEWWPWAAETRRLLTVQRVYTRLFAMYQRQQRLGEAYEVVLGLGHLTWTTPAGHLVKRHLIVAQTSLAFDARRGVITVCAGGEGAQPALEQDMLDPHERLQAAERAVVEQQVAEVGDLLWDGVRVPAALWAWAHAASAEARVDDSLTPQIAVEAGPRVCLAPALILRRRSESGLRRTFQDIVDQLRAGRPVPPGVRSLVTIDDDRDPAPGEARNRQTPASAVYFPLPSNAEQQEIATRLATRRGVLVQGPPGTGKSHTIANLVCHLLATGQRVLVTSHTARALSVLQGMLPKEMTDLCVTVLGGDRDSLQGLGRSVQGITRRANGWDAQRNRREVEGLEGQLAAVRAAESVAVRELGAIREAEVLRHPRQFGTYAGTAQQIAQRVHEEAPRFCWLPVGQEGEVRPPLSDAEAVRLLDRLRTIDEGQESLLRQPAPDPDLLVSPADFAALVEREAESRRQFEAAAEREHPAVRPLASAPPALRAAVASRVAALLQARRMLEGAPQAWLRNAVDQILAGQHGQWQELLALTRQAIEAGQDRAREADERRVSGLGGRDRSVVTAQADALLRHLQAGGSLGFGPFDFLRPKPVRDALYLVKEVRVDGRLCETPAPLAELLDWIDVADTLDRLKQLWAAHVDVPAAGFALRLAAYRDLADLLASALALQDRQQEVREAVAAVTGVAEADWRQCEVLERLRAATAASELLAEWLEIGRSFDELEGTLRSGTVEPDAHPGAHAALLSVGARDVAAYAAAHHQLVRLRDGRAALVERDALFARLQRASPTVAVAVRESPGDRAWDARLAAFEAAWAWGCADRWVRQMSAGHEQERAAVEAERCRAECLRLVGELAAAKAWSHCMERLTVEQSQHLVAWSKAVRRVGKGTGKYAPQHRRAAREHMAFCRPAIPAWIMPVYRVAETVRPGQDAFDVVIVDEASQSGPEALFLQYIASKIVVVGDDQQISPDFVGLKREDVDRLRRDLIADVPFNDALGVDNSYFDQAEIRYRGRIRLREHFRCMPEIIGFSNALCYADDPLVPLRQYGAQRLSPVVAAVHVPNGYLNPGADVNVNPPEAAALVAHVERCCADQAYAGKTMGVISLVGSNQAEHIERLLLERLGPKIMEERRLVCGDAYAFQGDERDVMFLSLVSAPSPQRRVGTLSSQTDQRRFNVAASRARDQLWLFHTATLDLLRPNCMRYRLLEYCQHPPAMSDDGQVPDPAVLRAGAVAVQRRSARPPFPFASWLELDVYLALTDRGYRVLPGVDVAGHRLDLVVEGGSRRLAVECEGDTWDGPDRYAVELGRQRLLERCGWTVWRVRGSAFSLDGADALRDLWPVLARLGIAPGGRDAGDRPAGRDTELPSAVDVDVDLDEAPTWFPSDVDDVYDSEAIGPEELPVESGTLPQST